MPCANCGQSAQPFRVGAHKAPTRFGFGRCSRCFFLSIIAVVVSLVLVVGAAIAGLPRALTWITIVPLVLASVGLTLHVIGYLRRR